MDDDEDGFQKSEFCMTDMGLSCFKFNNVSSLFGQLCFIIGSSAYPSITSSYCDRLISFAPYGPLPRPPLKRKCNPRRVAWSSAESQKFPNDFLGFLSYCNVDWQPYFKHLCMRNILCTIDGCSFPWEISPSPISSSVIVRICPWEDSFPSSCFVQSGLETVAIFDFFPFDKSTTI